MIQIDTDLLELLPDFYAPITDYQEIMQAEETELEQLAVFLNAVHDNFFIQTMDEGTTVAWEQALGIQTLDSDTLAFRRMRVLNRITTKPPFTLPFLKARLDGLLGPDNYTLDVDYGNYTLTVSTAPENLSYAVEIAFTVNQIKPAHIRYITSTGLYAGIGFSEEISDAALTYNYKLGGWFLGDKPFISIGSWETTKMPSTSSVQKKFLTSVGTDITSLIAKVRLNNSVVLSVSDITTGSDATKAYVYVQYTVNPTDVAAINKVELLDSSNNVLTSSNVYIPVTTTLSVKHTIRIEEAA